MKPTSLLTALTLTVPLLSGCLTGCLFGGNDDGDGKGNPALAGEPIGVYTIAGDTLFMNLASDTTYFCRNGVREKEVDSARVDTTLFTLAGDRLTLFERTEPGDGDGGTGPGPDIQNFTVFTRRSGGPGLDGTWRLSDHGYRAVGELSAEEKAAWDRRLASQRRTLDYTTVDIAFAAGKAAGRFTARWADMFVAEWNGEFTDGWGFDPDSALYDVRPEKVDDHTVRLAGRKSGEAVTVRIDDDGDRSYSSDRAGRKPYADNPDTCPAVDVEAWYQDFLTENSKEEGLGKAAAPAARRPGPAPRPFAPW